MSVCPGRRRWGAVARESRLGREPHAERAEEGLTLEAGGPRAWRPRPAAGKERAPSPRGSVRRRSSQDRRTGGRRRRPRPPQPRSEPPLPDRWAAVPAPAARRGQAGGRRRSCPGRAGPLGRPPPPVVTPPASAGDLLATALPLFRRGRRAGHPGGPAEKLGETCGRTGGRGRDGASRAGLPETRVAGGEGLPAPAAGHPRRRAPRPAVPPLSESVLALRRQAPSSVTLLGTPRDVFHVPLCTDPL